VKYTNQKAKREKHMNKKIKIVVIGGTGLIGIKVVNNLATAARK
jgi:nucleoside-diphosphate-sugar epimerase